MSSDDLFSWDLWLVPAGPGLTGLDGWLGPDGLFPVLRLFDWQASMINISDLTRDFFHFVYPTNVDLDPLF